MADPVIMVAESTSPRYSWRQYFVITDERCVVVEMLPALLGGWKFHRIIVQGAESWPDMTADQIVAFKRDGGYAPDMAGDLGDFRARLLSVAAAGTLPEVAS